MINFKNAEKSSELFSNLTPAEMKNACIMGAISAELINQRHQMNLTQHEFADFLGVSQGMVSKWEKPGYNFTIKALVNLFDKIGIDVDISFNGTSIFKEKSKNAGSKLINLNKSNKWIQTTDGLETNSNKVEGAA